MSEGDYKTEDILWMQRAIDLAHRSEGWTRPNPPVGAVLVKNGRVIGEGRHKFAGGDHAEVAAFEACCESAQGATLYVTLEPCSTHGRTPPCTERIISEGVRRVVIGCLDRNERHNGRAVDILKEHGIEVDIGICQAQALELVEAFFKHQAENLPWVTLKLAMTMDGCIADREGISKWITGPEARAEVQQLRRRADAVMVGSRTVVADDPSLLCRIDGGENLLRVVVDSRSVLPASAKIFTDTAAERTLVFTSVETPTAVIDAWRRYGAGVELMQTGTDGFAAIGEVLHHLGSINLMHVLCEGGGGLAAALHNAGMVDEYILFYAPLICADLAARRGFASEKVCLLNDMKRLETVAIEMCGQDIMVRLRPVN